MATEHDMGEEISLTCVDQEMEYEGCGEVCILCGTKMTPFGDVYEKQRLEGARQEVLTDIMRLEIQLNAIKGRLQRMVDKLLSGSWDCALLATEDAGLQVKIEEFRKGPPEKVPLELRKFVFEVPTTFNEAWNHLCPF